MKTRVSRKTNKGIHSQERLPSIFRTVHECLMENRHCEIDHIPIFDRSIYVLKYTSGILINVIVYVGVRLVVHRSFRVPFSLMHTVVVWVCIG